VKKIHIAPATDADRDTIYRLRHAIYAVELGQHAPNAEGRLRDSLDAFNAYLVAREDSEVVGFISITPPGNPSYSIDKYFDRQSLPFCFDAGLYEVRILTVSADHRGRILAALLMYGAFRWVESRGGTRIVAIGRREVRGMYLQVGLEPLGMQTQSGAVTYELMSATTADLRKRLTHFASTLRRLERLVAWELDVPFYSPERCPHGGAFFEAVGETFETLYRSTQVVNADVLDAWFPPAPGALQALEEYLPWLMKTSPPTDCAGLVQTIAEVRNIPCSSIAVGAGSSNLIYLALMHWLHGQSRVLILDPMYGEYGYLGAQVIGCRVERFPLSRTTGYEIAPSNLLRQLQETRYDLVVLVNPNNPTGRLLPRSVLEPLLAEAPQETLIWIDEAYIEYAGGHESVEETAARSRNVVVCKSLSKGYALSGARAAYLCGPPPLMEEIRRITPPWAVSLPAQVAAVAALRDPAYYAQRYWETATLRGELVRALKQALPSIDILEGVANFVLCHLPPQGPDAATVGAHCRAYDVFVRDAGAMSALLGSHTLRIAVKDENSNQRTVEALTQTFSSPVCFERK